MKQKMDELVRWFEDEYGKHSPEARDARSVVKSLKKLMRTYGPDHGFTWDEAANELRFRLPH